MGETNKKTGSAAWQSFLLNKRYRKIFFISLIILAAELFLLTLFLEYAESRKGITIPDPLLSLFTAVDFTWLIFLIIYASLAAALLSLLPHPQELLFAVQLYAFMVVVRIIAMFLLPLEPPEGIIILKDPFVEFFGTGKSLTKDLFFSGHTASILIFFFTAKSKIFKTIFLLLVIFIAVLVILQKVHYTIDVYAAVFFTTACYYVLRTFKEKYNI